MTTHDQITVLLRRMEGGELGAIDELMRVVHGDLERMASSHLRKQYGHRAGQLTLEPAALVNESFMRLLKQRKGYENRRQFFAIATKVMLRVLSDYRRQRSARDRKGHRITRLTVALEQDSSHIAKPADVVDVEALAQALEKLDALDSRKGAIVKMRVVWGMTLQEIAAELDVSPTTVERDWRFARVWLAEEIESPEAD